MFTVINSHQLTEQNIVFGHGALFHDPCESRKKFE